MFDTNLDGYIGTKELAEYMRDFPNDPEDEEEKPEEGDEDDDKPDEEEEPEDEAEVIFLFQENVNILGNILISRIFF